MWKRLYSINILDQTARFYVPQGLWSGFFLSFDGTNQSGQTFANSDLGTMITRVNGNEKDNFEVPRLFAANNVVEGVNESSTSAGAAFRHIVKLPFYNYAGTRPDYGNAFLVRNKDTMEVEHQFPAATSTVVASGNITYWGLRADFASRCMYETRFKQYNITIGSSGESTHNIEVENAAALFLGYDANLTSLEVKVDDEVMLERTNRDDLVAYTQQRYNIKTFSATQTPLIVPFTNTLAPESTQNRRLQFNINAGGAFTLNVLAHQVMLTPSRLLESIQIGKSMAKSKAASKAAQGITPAAEYLQAQS